VWIAYLALDDDALAWMAFVLLILVALLGFAMLLRWLPVYRARADAEAPEPAERRSDHTRSLAVRP
jgi:predicted MFS family arabinose efflux permease